MTPSLENHQGQIRKKAIKYSDEYKIDRDDLINQGVLIFFSSIETYNPQLDASFNTWLYINLQWLLHRYCLKNRMDLAENIDAHYLSNILTNTTKNQRTFSHMLRDLSPEAHEVVDIVFNQDKISLKTQKGKRLTQKALRVYLHTVKKWQCKKIDHCFGEIKQGLRRLQ